MNGLPKQLDAVWADAVRTSLTALKRERVERPGRRAAVLMLFTSVDGQPSLVFTKRSEKVGTHKGQVSFAGGMEDPGDGSPIATALREFEEELGLPGNSVQVLGLFHDAIAITGVPVTPVVAYCPTLPAVDSLNFSKDEIEAVFTLNFAALDDDSQRETQYYQTGQLAIPVFDAGPWPVWGLTAYIVNRFFKVMGWADWTPENTGKH